MPAAASQEVKVLPKGNWSGKMDQIDAYLMKLSPDAQAQAWKATARVAAAKPRRLAQGPFSWPDPAAERRSGAQSKHSKAHATNTGSRVGRSPAAVPGREAAPTLKSSSALAPSSTARTAATPHANGAMSPKLRGPGTQKIEARPAVDVARLAAATTLPPSKAVPEAVLEGLAAADAATRDLSEAEALIPAALPGHFAAGDAESSAGPAQAAVAVAAVPAEGGEPAPGGAGGSDSRSEESDGGAGAASRDLGEAEALMASALAL